MTSTSIETKHISQTQLSIESLQFAHRWLFKVMDDFNHEQWAAMLIDYGLIYANNFSLCFTDSQPLVYKVLTSAAPEAGCKHNWFWQWFKLKWMQDDWDYINDKVYLQHISYRHFKTYLIQNELLEVELINLLHDKQVLQNF